MPLLAADRQLDKTWFDTPLALRLVRACQRDMLPELTRVFGHSGLYLRPAAGVAEELSGNMLGQVLSLHRTRAGLAGALRCSDEALPVASDSQALAVAMLVLETSPSAEALLSELVRTVRPEGVLMIVSLNPWSPLRTRWAFDSLRSWSPGEVLAALRKEHLDIVRTSYIGPSWRTNTSRDASTSAGLLGERLRFAHLTIAKRRDPGMTPIVPRPRGSGVFSPGVSTG